MPEQIDVRQRRLWIAAWLYFAGAMLAYSWVILTAKMPPPFVDYPDWVYQGVLFHGVLTGHPFAGYILKSYPVPNSLTTVGLGLLDLLLPWQWAGKIWIVMYLALATFSIWIVLRAFRIREWRPVVALPAILFLNLDFWYGHISFEIGVCLVIVLLAMLKWNAPSSAIGAMLILLFFTHMEACAGALLLLAIWCAVTRHWRRLWASIPAILLTVWYTVARFSSGNADASGLKPDYPYGSPAFLIYKISTFFKTFGYVNAHAPGGLSQSEEIFGKVLFLFLIGASLVIAALCLWQLMRLIARARIDSSYRVITIFVLVLLAIATALPQIWLGVADPGSRLLLLAAAIGLVVIEWRRPAGTAIACLSVLFCVMNLWQFAQVENNPEMKGHPKDLPSALVKYGHVEPATRFFYYEELERKEMDQPIFPTGVFRQISK